MALLFLLLLCVVFVVVNVLIRRMSHSEDAPSKDNDGDGGEV